MGDKFKRRIESFICANCGKEIKGTGYTNHCPYCLWSKHVDNHPGDRESTCKGMMEPIRVERKGKEYIIVHRCKRCGMEKRNKSAVNDVFEVLLKISASHAQGH